MTKCQNKKMSVLNIIRIRRESELDSVRIMRKCQDWLWLESNSVRNGETWTVSKLETLGIIKCQNLKVSESKSVRIWKCQNLKVSESESARIKKCQNLKVPESKSVRIWKCQNLKVTEWDCVSICKCQNRKRVKIVSERDCVSRWKCQNRKRVKIVQILLTFVCSTWVLTLSSLSSSGWLESQPIAN